MRSLFLAIGVLALSAMSASAQSTIGQQSLAPGVNSGFNGSIGSDLKNSIASDLQAKLGDPGPGSTDPLNNSTSIFGDSSSPTLADPFNPYAALQGGSGCAPDQADPDARGCRPFAWIRNETQDPNRIQTYSGDSAFRSGAIQSGPNRIETYSGDSAFRY